MEVYLCVCMYVYLFAINENSTKITYPKYFYIKYKIKTKIITNKKRMVASWLGSQESYFKLFHEHLMSIKK